MKKREMFFPRIVGAIIVFVAMTITASAQMSEGGIPPSFSYRTTLRSKKAVKEIPLTFNVEDLKQVDAWQESQDLTPPCVSTLIDVSLNPQNAGTWSVLPDGQEIWQLELHVRGAIALMLYYSDFYIPKGGKLFIYNTEKTQILGAYTEATNPVGGRFATEFVAGDVLTLEYVQAPDGRMPRIDIEAIGYGYNHIKIDRKEGMSFRRGLGSSMSCEVNINCEEGDAWQNEKKGVCHTVQRIGSKSFICTGSLVNNTAQDLKPYILTAMHCAMNGNITASSDDMKQWVFYFYREQSGCSRNSAPVESKTLTGCKKVAYTRTHGQSDGLLLLLNTFVPEDYDVYYNGWDCSNQPSQSGVCIHHPAGDYKKISTYLKPASHETFISSGGVRGDTHAHWNVIFVETTNGHGVTENGSSGSPLFNEHKLIVGTLTGGTSSCREPNGLNLFGKMYYHWNKYADNDSTHMDQFLDPKNSGVTMLEGRFYKVLASPSDLKANYKNGSVSLTWNAPVSGTPNTYRILRNNKKLEETSKLFYKDASPLIGNVTYSVSAVYSNGNQSSSISTDLVVSEYKAPIHVKAISTTAKKVAVIWDPPIYEQTIYWGGVNAKNQVNMNDKGDTKPFYFGQAWTKDEIVSLNQRTITAVKFIPVRTNTYEIYIAQGNRVYRQPIINVTNGKTNVINLTTPFVIDGKQSLIVAIYVSSVGGGDSNFPAICDEGPAIDGKGDIYSYDGKKWSNLHSGDEAEKYNFNFFIAAVVSSKKGELSSTYSAEERSLEITKSFAFSRRKALVVGTEPDTISMRSLIPDAFPEPTGYNVYRGEKKIATVSPAPTRYIDPIIQTQAVSYQVSTLYGSEESERSDMAEYTPMSIDSIMKVMLYPSLFTNMLYLSGNEEVKRIEFFSADGRRCMQVDEPSETIDTHSLSTGVYLIRIHLKGGGAETFRGIKR